MPKTKLRVVPAAAVSPADKFSVAELAELFGFPVSALVEAINRNSQSLRKPFYSISDIAARWDCSRATVLNVLRESELKLFSASSQCAIKRNSWRIPALVVKHVEDQRMKALSEAKDEEAA
jgi:predicted DNA-binding protein YlxM (UPF0122 family)